MAMPGQSSYDGVTFSGPVRKGASRPPVITSVLFSSPFRLVPM